jgi:hypothetical protein
MNNINYIALIAAIMEEYSDKIITKMVKKGYTISAGMKNNSVALSVESGASSLIALYVSSSQEITCDTIYKDLENIIREEKMYVYSVIVSERVNMVFAGTNILMPKKVQPPILPPASSDSNRKLN